MAGEGHIGEADRMAGGVMDAADGVNPQIGMGVDGQGGGRRGAGQGSGQPQTVVNDMRHAIIRDDRDMSDRLVRNGAGLTGAF